ncbi:phage integrase SAM-like domain-containing protein [Tamlana sp. 2201CG12-4]|uniref:tyrosine-type recombinase/integrase n=1 Tax=Tamlana sp. 2201CG12-4 TaxID=3112582 RepID=UPI002DBA78B5|nr:phage integrase SAM-like domain-containing protein [Tamlana sp. 2201CG12-4]MEC3905533.1 phage integrase SAM-like domain-containing protein [Tamlana sp. 2201CG12-4]
MANVLFLIKTKSNPSQIYVRFYHSKDFDLNAKTKFIVDPKLWSKKQQRVKITSDNAFDRIINPKLLKLKEDIILNYNLDFNSGKRIDKDWLNKIIANFHKQPLKESDNYKLFFVPFFEKYIEDSKTRINIDTGKVIGDRTTSKYGTTLKRICEFETNSQTKLRFSDIDLNFHKAFVSYLANELFYNGTNIQKHLNIIKGACREARTQGIEVNNEFEHRNFSFKREKTHDTYLNIDEISKIYNLDFSNNERLDNARDWLIIGVWTGLRISDMKRLSNVNLKSNTIEIETTKTSAKAIIPIHKDVKSILSKRNGNFPRPISDAKFNKYIKEVVTEAKITKKIFGGKMIEVKLPNGEKTYRKINDYYSKSELITSHTCRRSFASNHYGHLPNKTIMAITTHKSEAQFERYLKQSQMEHVEKMREYWESENKKNEDDN